jgi:hypothetical protein
MADKHTGRALTELKMMMMLVGWAIQLLSAFGSAIGSEIGSAVVFAVGSAMRSAVGSAIGL